MKKTLIKTLSLTFAIGVLSLIGFNSALGYGGGGGGGFAAQCSSVTYGPWGENFSGVQFRDVIDRTPSNCQLSTSQQLARSRDFVAEPVSTDTETAEETTSDEDTTQTNENEGEVSEETVTPQVLGDTSYEEGTLLRGSDMKIYVVVDGKLKHIISLEELAKYAGQEILDVDDSEIDSFDEAQVLGDKTYADGTLLRGSDMKIYVVVDGKLKHIVSLEDLKKYAGIEILNVSDDVIDGMEKA